MTTGSRKNSRGMTLFEVLVYTAISAVVLNLCAVTFVQTTRLASLTTERLMRQQALAQFSRDFARAVHGAARVLPNIGDTETGEGRVVLDTSDGPKVVGMAGESLAIWELHADGNAWSIGKLTSYRVALRSVRFELDSANPADARRITAYITGPARRDPDDTSHDRVIVAGLRAEGDAP